MWSAAVSHRLAVSAASFLPLCAATNPLKSLMVPHAAAVLPRAKASRAFMTSFKNALSGAILATSTWRITSWSSAPVTCTLKLASVEFPPSSLAWRTTVLTPTGNTDPDAGPDTRLTVAGPQLSRAVAVYVKTAPSGRVASTTTKDCPREGRGAKVSTGGVWSTTVTRNGAEASGATPLLAVAVTRVLVPRANGPSSEGLNVTVGAGKPVAV